MHINVTFRHMESSDAIKSYVDKRFTKLERYLHDPIKFEVWLAVEKSLHTAEAEVISKGYDAKFQADGKPDIYAAIDNLASKMEKAIRRHKEKVKDHKTAAAPEPEPAVE